MAMNRMVLLQLVTLCFVLLMLMPAAHGKKGGNGGLIIYGTARCKSNPSTTINNATLLLIINDTMVATSKTSSSGRFLLVANVTSKDQLMAALTKREAAITAPPQACGGGGSVPGTAATGRKLATAAGLIGSDDGDVEIPDLRMVTVDQLIEDILNSPPVDDHDLDMGENITGTIDDSDTTEFSDLQIFLVDSGLATNDLVNRINDALGIPQIQT